MSTTTQRRPRPTTGPRRPACRPATPPAPLERIEHTTHRYEIYSDPDGQPTCWLIAIRHERAYLILEGSRDRCHDTAVQLIHFGGYPLIERSRAPQALKHALGAGHAHA